MAREFYPLVSRTIKSLLKIPPKDSLAEYVRVITEYPDYTFTNIDGTDAIMAAIIDELKRQYDRWNKGGNNEKL